ncbi:MAG TPA: hypothetical protein PKC65_00430 [Pyrinomonadaceae bacterium]|nr:hypothetical protein [Pyrinomonadaceae bacterium]
MKPLIFEFLERPLSEGLDLSRIEYDDVLNLNVDKITRLPAIEQIHLGTETFTRTNEVSDTDATPSAALMSTETATKVAGEGSDQDRSSLSLVMATETFTTSHNEGSDHDVDVPERYQFFNSLNH